MNLYNMKLIIFYLLNIEKISPSFHSFLFNKRFQQKQLLTNLSSLSLSSFDKLKHIKIYESTFNESSEYNIDLWKHLNIYDF